MIEKMETTQFLDETTRLSAATDQEVASRFTGLSPTQINWKSEATTWTIGQEFDHMLRANRTYVVEMKKVLEKAGAAKPEFKPSFWGKLIYKAAKPGKSMNVPVTKTLIPTESPLDESVVKEYLEVQKTFNDLLAQARGKDLDARFVSPLAAIARMRLGDAFRITAAHNQRHVEKALRLLDDPNFPG